MPFWPPFGIRRRLFGTLVAPHGLPSAPMWLPFGSVGPTWVSLWLPLGSLGVPLGSLLPPFSLPWAPVWPPFAPFRVPFGWPLGSLWCLGPECIQKGTKICPQNAKMEPKTVPTWSLKPENLKKLNTSKTRKPLHFKVSGFNEHLKT